MNITSNMNKLDVGCGSRPDAQKFKVMVLSLFDTCNFNCGYCNNALLGQGKNLGQLEKFKDLENVDRILGFFSHHLASDEGWKIVLSGGEPLIMPNIDYFLEEIATIGCPVGIYTNLSPWNLHKIEKLTDEVCSSIEYMMCSFHPEWFKKEREFFARIELLQKRGVSPLVRVVGDPRNFKMLDRIEKRCDSINVTFMPICLYGWGYPRNYTSRERKHLGSFMKTYISLIQLYGSALDVTKMKCSAGTKLFEAFLSDKPRWRFVPTKHKWKVYLNLLRTFKNYFKHASRGNIFRCGSTTESGRLGNVFDNTLSEVGEPAPCPLKSCNCEIYFHEDVVIGASDFDNFDLAKHGKGRSVQNDFFDWLNTNNLRLSNFDVTYNLSANPERKLIWTY